jgi:NAD+---dinitrogen-reductase ADP-D-ribosyltransferase
VDRRRTPQRTVRCVCAGPSGSASASATTTITVAVAVTVTLSTTRRRSRMKLVRVVMKLASFNRCNLSASVIASYEFNDDPQPLEISGVRHAHAPLFGVLDTLGDACERSQEFDHWVSVCLERHLHHALDTDVARRTRRHSYLRFLRGWGVESSSIEGAVLKSWVENRFGIPPTYHREPITSRSGEAYVRYVRDQMVGSVRTAAIFRQLDLVYAYTQYELSRQHPGARWLTLYRGQYDIEPEVVRILPNHERVVRLNNLCSFTDDVECAWEFGSTVWKAAVALPRIVCATWLFPRSILRSERELLVVGAEMRVQQVRA